MREVKLGKIGMFEAVEGLVEERAGKGKIRKGGRRGERWIPYKVRWVTAGGREESWLFHGYARDTFLRAGGRPENIFLKNFNFLKKKGGGVWVRYILLFIG